MDEPELGLVPSPWHDDDDRDDKKDKDVCKAKNWTPPLIDFQKSSKPKIKFCLVKPKDTERCNMQTASYLGFDQWRNFTSLQQRFWTSKNKKDMYLQVNKAIKAMIVFQVVCCATSAGKSDQGLILELSDAQLEKYGRMINISL